MAEDIVSRFFEPWEEKPVDSWESAKKAIQKIVPHEEKSPSWRRLVWRGLNDSRYAMHSTLYRQLLDKLGQPPSEDDMRLAEYLILQTARSEWRFGNLSALETFAQIRHYGGPTRLIDVSFNPLIALWFAVQPSDEDKEGGKPADGRIVASLLVVMDPDRLEAQQDKKDIRKSEIPLRMFPYSWRPPSYNERISAQNSAFLIGEVPRGGSKNPWAIDGARGVASIKLEMASIQNFDSENTNLKLNLAFTIRILGEAKEEIRKALERQFGYAKASIYPDLYGLAEYLNDGSYITDDLKDATVLDTLFNEELREERAREEKVRKAKLELLEKMRESQKQEERMRQGKLKALEKMRESQKQVEAEIREEALRKARGAALEKKIEDLKRGLK